MDKKYDSMVFDRRIGGAGAMKRVLGIGHPVVDFAISEALELDVRVAEVAGLSSPLLVVSFEDQVTGTNSPSHRLILGVREVEGERQVLRDWELLKTLNERRSHSKSREAGSILRAAADLTAWIKEHLRQVDAVEVGRSAGMRHPASWPEMLLLPPKPSDERRE